VRSDAIVVAPYNLHGPGFVFFLLLPYRAESLKLNVASTTHARTGGNEDNKNISALTLNPFHLHSILQFGEGLT
jgi:hypothetical protein